LAETLVDLNKRQADEKRIVMQPSIRRKLIIAFVLFDVAIVAAVMLIYKGYIRFNYPDLKEFPIRGIDISHHQGNINWQELAQENLSFVIIKATEGGDFVDPKFSENWQNARQSGYRTGAYHFYRLCKTPEEQAANFGKVVPKDSNALPPSVDLEFGGNCETDKTTEQVLKEIQRFLTLLENDYGAKPIIYATPEFYDTYLKGQLTGYPIWIRDIYGRPDLPDGRSWYIWQYANRGHLKGIETYVDLNVLNGNSF